jgi:nicotinamidase-related amidase
MCGVYTNECVETTTRDASDIGFFTTVIEDACATVTPELHFSSLNTLRDRYARILTTAQAVTEITRLCEPSEVRHDRPAQP